MLAAAEQDEVFNRQEVQVRRIEPVVGEKFRFGSASAEKVRYAHAPVPEVWERDDGSPAHPKHLRKHAQGVSHLLERLAEDYKVEGSIGIVRETLVYVALVNGDSASDCLLHLLAADFHAARIN